MAPRRSTPRRFNALPWLVGIAAVALAALVYVGFEGTGPSTTPPGPVQIAFSPAPGPSVAPARPSPQAPELRDGNRGRPDPFASLVSSEGAPPSRLPSPAGVPLPPPPGGAIPSPAPVQPGAGMTVNGIMGGASRVAIVQTEEGTYVVGVGDPVRDATVLAILADQVVLKQRNITFTLTLAPGGTVSSEVGEATPCQPVRSQAAQGPGPEQPAAPAQAPTAPATASGAPPSVPSSSPPASGSGGPSISYAPGIPPGVSAPTPSNLVGVQSPSPGASLSQAGGGSGGQSVSYAPGIPPGVTAPQPSGVVGVQSAPPGRSPASAASPAQPAPGASQASPSVGTGPQPSGPIGNPTPLRQPGPRPPSPPC